jgi:NO-binding membrane sensor protein with MHYT domain
MCEVYGMAGSLFGCASIWSMTFIALDRYNVIVKVKNEWKFLAPSLLKSIYFRVLQAIH